ncbi:hypothetical protein AAVH_30728, partial [Aphelenchoides avenae]
MDVVVQILRGFLSSHFAASVKRVFVWMDLPDDNVVAEVFVTNIVADVTAAAARAHVVFVVMPPPFDDHRLQKFETFMRHFNGASPKLPNVLWLDEEIRWNGYRFSYSLGSNELVSDHSSVYPDGTVSSKGASAAIKFLSNYCGWLIIAKPEAETRPPSSSNDASLHSVRGGKVGKNPARGAPSRGGGGGFQRGRGYQSNFARGRGNQSNFGH